MVACGRFAYLSPEKYRAMRPDAQYAIDQAVLLLERLEDERLRRLLQEARLQ